MPLKLNVPLLCRIRQALPVCLKALITFQIKVFLSSHVFLCSKEFLLFVCSFFGEDFGLLFNAFAVNNNSGSHEHYLSSRGKVVSKIAVRAHCSSRYGSGRFETLNLLYIARQDVEFWLQFVCSRPLVIVTVPQIRAYL